MTLPVFYRPEMVAANVASYSPSAAKPAMVVADWLKHDIIKDEEIYSFEPATRLDLYLAHDRDYVDGVLDLEIENGFRNTAPSVAASLPYTVGSMIAAADFAVTHQCHTVSPTSGFHHAGYDFGGGFCTFNGLVVAAKLLKEQGLVNRVAILDCDMHYGNGTQDIIDRQNLHWIKHHTFGKHFADRADVGKDAGKFRQWLDAAIKDCADSDLVIYQAGADPHINDPLGGVLHSHEMAWRDRRVVDELGRKALVWNLAGGYQRDKDGGIDPVLALHRVTMNIWKGNA